MQKQINPGDAEQTNRPLANAQHAPDYSTALLSKKIIGSGAHGTPSDATMELLGRGPRRSPTHCSVQRDNGSPIASLSRGANLRSHGIANPFVRIWHRSLC